MYGTHVILYDSLTDETHDALVVGSQAAYHGGPEELLNLAYVRKDGAKAAMHEHRILYRMAVRPADHLDVAAGKVTHWYKVPNVPLAGAVGEDALRYAILVDANILGTLHGSERVGVLLGETTEHPAGRKDVAVSEVKVGDVLALGPYPVGSTVTDISDVEDGVIEIICTGNPKQQQQTGDLTGDTTDGATGADPNLIAANQGPGDPAAANSAVQQEETVAQ